MFVNWPLFWMFGVLGLGALILGGLIVSKLDEVRTELARGGGGLIQVGTDLNELVQRIADNAATGDPTDADVAAAKAIGDGLVDLGTRIDAILAAPEPPPVEPPVEPTP